MALPIVDRIAGFARTRWWALLVALFVATAVVVVTLQQRSFVSDIRTVAGSNVDYLLLCGFRRGVTYEPCQVIGSPKLAATLAHLASASARLPPSKATPIKEMMLRLGRGPVSDKQYLGCFRVARFADAEDIYISEITTDRDCTRIEKYQAGYVVIPGNGLGHGAI